MGSDLSIVLQTCVPSPDGLVQAFQDAGLVKGSNPLCYVELRVMKADAAVQFISDVRASTTRAAASARGAASAAARNQVSLLVANCYSFVVGSSTTTKAAGGAGAGAAAAGKDDKEDEQQAVYDQVRRAVRYEASCGKRLGLVVDASVQLGERVQEPQQGYRFARGTTYFLSSLLTALEYDVPRDEEVWTLSESPAPTLYLLDVRHNSLDDYAGPWLMKDVLERVRRVRHHALTVRRQALVHTRIAQRHGHASSAPTMPPPPKMIADGPTTGTSAPVAEAPRRASASSLATTDIMAAMDGDSEFGGTSEALAKKDLIFDVPIYMPNVRSDLFMGSLQCVLLSDNDLTLNGVDQVLDHLFETEQLASQRLQASSGAKSSALAHVAPLCSAQRLRLQESHQSSNGDSGAGSHGGTSAPPDRQLVVDSDASTLLLPYLLLIDVRRNAFDELAAEALLQSKVGPLVQAREMTVLDAPGKPPPELSPLEKQRLAIEKKKEEHRLQKEEAKRRKDEKKRKLEEERQRLLEERKRAQKEKAARQLQREAAEEKRREAEKRELLAAMDALRNPPAAASSSVVDADEEDHEEEEEDGAHRDASAARRAAPSDAGQWLDDEGGLVAGDVPSEVAAPPPLVPSSNTAQSRRGHPLSPRAPQPTGATPPRDQQPEPTPKKIVTVRPLSRSQLESDPNAPPQLKDKSWSPQYARRPSRTPRQPLPTSASPRSAPPPQRSPSREAVSLSSVRPSPSPAPVNPSAQPVRAAPAATAATAPVRSAHKVVKAGRTPVQTPVDTPHAPTPSLPSRRSSRSDHSVPELAETRGQPTTRAALAPPVWRQSPRSEDATTGATPRPRQPVAAAAPPPPPLPPPTTALASKTAKTATAAVRPVKTTPRRTVSPSPAAIAPVARRNVKPVSPQEAHYTAIDDDDSESDENEDLLWADPYTGAALGEDPDYPALPDEAPDVVRARRSYSLGRGHTPRRLAGPSSFTPPPLPIAPPPVGPAEASTSGHEEMRHSPRKSRWSEEAEELRFNEGVAMPYAPEPLVPEAMPSSRRSTAGRPPIAPSSSRRSASLDFNEHAEELASSEVEAVSDDDADDEDNVPSGDYEEDEDEEEPMFDRNRPRPAARPSVGQKPRKKSSTPQQPQQQQQAEDPQQRQPRSAPRVPSHVERQSIRRDSVEEREWRALQDRDSREEDDVTSDHPEKASAAAQSRDGAPLKNKAANKKDTRDGNDAHQDGEEDDWARDVYDANDPDVWGPPYKPPPATRASPRKSSRAGKPTAPVEEASDDAAEMQPNAVNDPDVWGPPFKAPIYDTPKKKRKSSAKAPADEDPSSKAASKPEGRYDANDPDVWGPPYQPQKRTASTAARPHRATNASAVRAGAASRSSRQTDMDSTDDLRRASYVVPFSTSTSRMRAFYGQQKRVQRERTASQDARLRLAARPATINKDSDVFRSPRKQTFVDPGPDEYEGLAVDATGECVDDIDDAPRAASVAWPRSASAHDARAPSQFKRHDSATRGASGAPDSHEWNYRFPVSPSRSGATPSGKAKNAQDADEESLAGVRQTSPSPQPYMAGVLPRDGIVQTPSVSPASQALDRQAHDRPGAAVGVSSLRTRPSVIRPGLGFEPPHPKIQTRSRSRGH